MYGLGLRRVILNQFEVMLDFRLKGLGRDSRDPDPDVASYWARLGIESGLATGRERC